MLSGGRYLLIPPFSSSGLHVNYDKSLTKLGSHFIFWHTEEQPLRMLCYEFWLNCLVLEATAAKLLPLPPKSRISSKITKVIQIWKWDKTLQLCMPKQSQTNLIVLLQLQMCSIMIIFCAFLCKTGNSIQQLGCMFKVETALSSIRNSYFTWYMYCTTHWDNLWWFSHQKYCLNGVSSIFTDPTPKN